MLTDKFVKSLMALRAVSISAELRNVIQGCLLDWCGCFLAGVKTLKSSGHPLDDLQGGLVGRALQLGYLSHLVELDDGHRFGMVHPGAPVVSALFAVAEREEVGADDFLRAVLIGYETTIRLACAVQPGCKLRGYHATGTCGAAGAAMSVAALLHFNEPQTKCALSAALSSGAGLLEMIEGESELKPYNAGRAAMDGVMAALFGRQGFRSPVDALGGKRGFLNAMTDSPRIEYLEGMPNGRYAIETIYQKPYAACRHCHAPIEAALKLAAGGIHFENIDKVRVETYKLAIDGHDHCDVSGISSAKMSIPYSVAAALIVRSGGLTAFMDGVISNPRVKALANRVRVVERSDFSAACPNKRIAHVYVKFLDGAEMDAQVDFPKGEPENPLSSVELGEKFMELARFSGKNAEKAFEISNMISMNKINPTQLLKEIDL